MTIASGLHGLWLALHRLRDAALGLRLLVCEDLPDGVAPQPVRALCNGVEDVFGMLSDAIERAAATVRAAEPAGDPRQIRQALAACHRCLLDLSRRWTDEVSAHHRLTQLETAARERGARWRAWARSVTEAVDGCHAPLWDVHIALLGCWEELAERALPLSWIGTEEP
ncbi:MAG: hypothetical protein ACRD0K_10005 [Egibacteraceae bacterium]